jgi:glycosyltransferase involved in cell wall biosynthesis
MSFLKENGDKILSGSIIVIIPAYNEEKNLEIVLPRIPDTILNIPVTTLVIDDGSADETAAISEKLGALVAIQKTNRGGGAALKVGYEIIKKLNPAVIVTMDADGQHNPEEIERLVEPLLNKKSDFIIGSRILGECEKYSHLRIFGVTFFSKIINMMIGTQITDCSSGFRAINKKVLEKCLLFQEQYHTAEIIIEAGKRGFRIDERPITITKRSVVKAKKGKISLMPYTLSEPF